MATIELSNPKGRLLAILYKRYEPRSIEYVADQMGITAESLKNYIGELIVKEPDLLIWDISGNKVGVNWHESKLQWWIESSWTGILALIVFIIFGCGAVLFNTLYLFFFSVIVAFLLLTNIFDRWTQPLVYKLTKWWFGK